MKIEFSLTNVSRLVLCFSLLLLVTGYPSPNFAASALPGKYLSESNGAVPPYSPDISSHTCALLSNGGVKCWGSNYFGQLGDGTNTDRRTPVDVVGLASGVTAIATGGYHTCALLSSGGVKCWGLNVYGQLGNGTNTSSSTPVDVVGLASGVTAISAGGAHTCALLSSGGVKCWGSNSSGQLGDGTTKNRIRPVDVVGLAGGVTAISAGGYHTCALLSSGGVKCWGSNSSGQLGDGTNTSSSTPVVVVDLANGVTALVAGEGHTCALLSIGGAKCWGSNSSGQLGDSTLTDRNTPVEVVELDFAATAILASGSHTCATLSDGEMKCWGSNKYGEVGDGTELKRSIAVDVVGLASDITAIAAGGYHTCALLSSGGVKCWGKNYFGQLGDGTTTDRSTPVDVVGLASGVTSIAAGGYHTCALLSSGGVKCWGLSFVSTPVDVVGLAGGVTAIATGESHTCALLSSGGVKCWGSNSSGQLGDGTNTDSSTPVDVVGLASGVINIAAAGGSAFADEYSHTCALLSGGGMKCWGENTFGQLGDGTTGKSSVPVDVVGLTSGVAAITTGHGHTCALMMTGGMKCWGANGSGQLGDGTTTDRYTPVDVIGLASGVKAIAAGGGSIYVYGGSYIASHSCALTSMGRLQCWGSNLYGQLGDGTSQGSTIPVEVAGMASNVLSIDAGFFHTCALVGVSRPKCWGSDWDGQLGVGTTLYKLIPVNVAFDPPLTINFPDGQPGSFFTITGWSFPPGAQATITINGQMVGTGLTVNPTGSFIFFLDSSSADPGIYHVTVSTNPSSTVSFRLDEIAPLRTQEGGGQTFFVPAGIAYRLIFLPLVIR